MVLTCPYKDLVKASMPLDSNHTGGHHYSSYNHLLGKVDEDQGSPLPVAVC